MNNNDNDINSHLITIYDNGNVKSYGVPNDKLDHAYYLREYLKEYRKDSPVTKIVLESYPPITINTLAAYVGYTLKISTLMNIRTPKVHQILISLPNKIDENLENYLYGIADQIQAKPAVSVQVPSIEELDGMPTISFKGLELQKGETGIETIDNIISAAKSLSGEKTKTK